MEKPQVEEVHMKPTNPSDTAVPQISKRRDDHYKRMIAHSFFSFLRNGELTREQVYLIERATPEERQVYVYKRAMRAWVFFLCACAFLVWVELQPAKPLPSEPQMEIIDAGAVNEIQLHETSFSTSSTVLTTTGVYQVYGGVSAANGDTARIESKELGLSSTVKKFLCIKSAIKSACYPLM